MHNITNSNEAVSVPHTMIGSRLIDMPSARILNSVTTKFAAPTVVEMPSRMTLMAATTISSSFFWRRKPATVSVALRL